MPPATRKATAKKATPRKRTPPAERFPWDADSFPDQASVEAALAALKEAVVRKVNSLTERHGWCDAAQRGLLELRLVKPPKPVLLTIEVEVNRDTLATLGWQNMSDADLRDRIAREPRAAARHGTLKSTRITEVQPQVVKKAAARKTTPGPAA